MFRLHSCTQGHFWEAREEAEAALPLRCPQCGAPTEDVPLLGLAPTELLDAVPAGPIDVPLLEDDGTPVVAGYEIVEALGSGPSGIRRYRAKQRLVDRLVLLEVVLAREDTAQRAWSSLRGEAAALGKIAHPNIVAIHDAGERDRQLFYNAVTFVEGPTLAQKVADRALPLPQVVRLLELLAWAIDHSNQRGVLHRHLEPTQVLLQPVGERGNASPAGAHCPLHSGLYVPLLTGFGLARRPVENDPIDAPLYDDPGYLSPEQAWGKAKEIGPHTDVYGLGGILYFLLTGRPPYRGPTLGDRIDAVQTADLNPPSAFHYTPADLEAICLKCLARLPRRRYARARDLAEELGRFARGEPVRARQPTGLTALVRWLGRHPTVAALFLLAMIAAGGTMAGYVWLLAEQNRAARQVQLARAETNLARSQVTGMQHQLNAMQQRQQAAASRQTVAAAHAALKANRPDQARLLLEGCPIEHRRLEWFCLMQQVLGDEPPRLVFGEGVVRKMAVPSAGRPLLAVACDHKGDDDPTARVQVWDLTQRRPTPMAFTIASPVCQLRFAPNGTRVAAVGGLDNGELVLYQLSDEPRLLKRQQLPGVAPTCLAFSPDSTELTVGRSDGQLMAWSAADGRVLPPVPRRLVSRTRSPRVLYRPDGMVQAVWSSDSPLVYLVGRDLRFTNVAVGGPGKVTAVEFGPDLLAIARSDGSVRLHHATLATEITQLRGLPGTVRHLAFSSDGTRLAAACAGGTVRLWARGDGWVELLDLNVDATVGLAFSADGRCLLAADGNGMSLLGAAP